MSHINVHNISLHYYGYYKYVKFDIEDKNERVKGFQDDLRYLYDDANMYVNMIREFDEYNLGTEFDSVMSDLFTASKMHMTWKDYVLD